MVITLIGYRGSGKSTIAPQLAARLGWDWIDADTEIERRVGRTIREIFETDGEPEFRRLERLMLEELTASDRLVIAAGGGAILDEQTRERCQDGGPIVWLQTSVATIERRIAGDRTSAERRPNLTTGGGRTEIETVLARREPIYRAAADVAVATDDRSTEEIVELIVRELDKSRPRGFTGGLE